MKPLGYVGFAPHMQVSHMTQCCDNAVLLPTRRCINVGREIAFKALIPFFMKITTDGYLA